MADSPVHAIAASVSKALHDHFAPTGEPVIVATADEIATVVAEHLTDTGQTPLLARQVAANLAAGLRGGGRRG